MNKNDVISSRGSILHKTIVEVFPNNKYRLLTGRYKRKYSYRIILKDFRFGIIYFASCNVLLKDCTIGDVIECKLKFLEFGCVNSTYPNGIIFCSLIKDYVSVVTNMVGSDDSDNSDRILGHEVRVRVPSLCRVAVG